MSMALQTQSAVRLPQVDTGNPASMTKLPEWLVRLTASVSDLGSSRVTIDPTTRQPVRRVATLPASLMPTGPQRAAIAERVADLRSACRPGPVEEIAEVVGGLLIERSSFRLDQKTMDAKTTGYLDALHDLPAWAVNEAVRRWRRGDAGEGIPATEYEFVPSTARLRRIAERIAMAAEGQAVRLQRILDAEPDYLPTEAERESNAQRLIEISRDVQTAASMAPVSRASGSAAEQEARDRETRAYWQRYVAGNAASEQTNDAA